MSAITVGGSLSSVNFSLGTWEAIEPNALSIRHSAGNIGHLSNETLCHLTILGFANISIFLTDPSDNINLQVIYDANGNFVFDDNEEVPVSLTRGANSSKTVSLLNLSPGSYYFYLYRTNLTIQTSFSFSYSARVGAANIRSSDLQLDRPFSPIDGDFGAISLSPDEWRPMNFAYISTALLSSLIASERLYRIRLLAIADLSVSISNLSPNVSINDLQCQIIRDADNNSIFEATDDIIPFSGSISLRNLAAGTYYIHVDRTSQAIETPFTLTVASTVASAPSGEQGTSLASAIELSVPVGAGNSMSQTGFLSVNQKNQFYRVSFNQSGVFDVTLLANNADIWLIQDKDNDKAASFSEMLSWKWARPGRSARIERFLTAGTYYLKVSSYDNQTSQFTISTRFVPITSNPQQFSIIPSYDGNFNSTAQAVVQEAINFWQSTVYWLKPDPSKKHQIPQRFEIQFSLDPNLGDSGNGGSELRNDDVVNARIRLGRPIVERLNSGKRSNLGLLIHEIAHTFWLAPSLPSTTFFISPLFPNGSEYAAQTYAGRVYGEILKRDSGPAVIPVNVGGHWAEDVFGDETMTPESNQDKDALSLLSLAALMDLDWNFEVNLSAAQPYALPHPGPSSALVPIEKNDKQELLFGGPLYPGAYGYAATQVGAAHPSKFYVINLAQPGTISLSLNQTLSQTLVQTSPEERAAMNATMRLLSESREQLGSSQSSINQNVSKAGRYYVEVYAGFFIDKAGNRRFGQSNYNLQYRISS